MSSVTTSNPLKTSVKKDVDENKENSTKVNEVGTLKQQGPQLTQFQVAVSGELEGMQVYNKIFCAIGFYQTCGWLPEGPRCCVFTLLHGQDWNLAKVIFRNARACGAKILARPGVLDSPATRGRGDYHQNNNFLQK
jgi:hypothetical protein